MQEPVAAAPPAAPIIRPAREALSVFKRAATHVAHLVDTVKGDGGNHKENLTVEQAYHALLHTKPGDRSVEEVDGLVQLTRPVAFLRGLGSNIHREVCQYMRLETYRNEGTIVTRQGQRGDRFYIILSGHVAVYVKGGAADIVNQEQHEYGILVRRLKAGDSFGELALTSRESVRQATAITEAPNTIFVYLTKDDYDRILATQQSKEAAKCISMLQRLPFFATIPKLEVNALGRVSGRKVYNVGEVVQEEGELVSKVACLMIIIRGECHVSKRIAIPTTSGKPKLRAFKLCTVGAGHPLMESEVIENLTNPQPPDVLYSFTVTAATCVDMVYVSKHDFARYIKPHDDAVAAIIDAVVRVPDAEDVRRLADDSAAWRRYKKAMVNDLLLQRREQRSATKLRPPDKLVRDPAAASRKSMKKTRVSQSDSLLPSLNKYKFEDSKAIYEAHRNGFLDGEIQGAQARFGCIQVAPLSNARMLQEFGAGERLARHAGVVETSMKLPRIR